MPFLNVLGLRTLNLKNEGLKLPQRFYKQSCFKFFINTLRSLKQIEGKRKTHFKKTFWVLAFNQMTFNQMAFHQMASKSLYFQQLSAPSQNNLYGQYLWDTSSLGLQLYIFSRGKNPDSFTIKKLLTKQELASWAWVTWLGAFWSITYF